MSCFSVSEACVWGAVLWDWTINLQDQMLSLCRQCQNSVQFLATLLEFKVPRIYWCAPHNPGGFGSGTQKTHPHKYSSININFSKSDFYITEYRDQRWLDLINNAHVWHSLMCWRYLNKTSFISYWFIKFILLASFQWSLVMLL